MKVRILSDVSDELRSYTSGEVVELPDEKAARFIKAGLAEEVTGGKKAAPEAAALADAPEHADLPAARRRG